MPLRVVGIYLERAAVRSNGIFESFNFAKCVAEIDVCAEIGGIDPDRLVVTVDGLGNTRLRDQNVAQIRMQLSDCRLNRYRASEMPHRFIESTLSMANEAKI